MPYIETLGVRSWTAPDVMASEEETGEFLYGLVRLMKPYLVVETGCYLGHTTQKIGEALSANGYGNLVTCDIDPEKVDAARIRCDKLPVLVKHMTGLELIRSIPDPVPLAFIDSGGDRVEEAVALKMAEDGLVVLHDAHRRTFDDILLSTKWKAVKINSPRGLAIFSA